MSFFAGKLHKGRRLKYMYRFIYKGKYIFVVNVVGSLDSESWSEKRSL